MGEQIFLFSSCTLHDDKLFFVEIQSGLPAIMDLDSGEVSYCDVLAGFAFIAGADIVDFIQGYGNKVYILETSGRNMIIFDLEKKQCQYIKLKCSYFNWGNFSAFERHGSFFYIFPKHEDEVVVLNTKNNELIEMQNIFGGINGIQCTCRVENQVWILPQNKSMIYVYDMATKKIESYKLDKALENCVDAVYADGNIYILNQFGIVYIWNIYKRELQEMTKLETDHTEDKSMCRIIFAGSKLIFFPVLSADIKILDLSTGEIEVYYDYPEDFKYHNIKWSKYHRSCEDKDYYYFAMRLGNYFLKVCKNDGKLLWMKPQLPLIENRIKSQDLFAMEKLKLYINAKKSICEEGNISIIHMINTGLKESCMEEESSIGRKIYEEVK